MFVSFLQLFQQHFDSLVLWMFCPGCAVKQETLFLMQNLQVPIDNSSLAQAKIVESSLKIWLKILH